MTANEFFMEETVEPDYLDQDFEEGWKYGIAYDVKCLIEDIGIKGFMSTLDVQVIDAIKEYLKTCETDQ